MINVTKTFLPPRELFDSNLDRAWSRGWITNRGELVQELEDTLKKYLSVPNVIAMTNGTLPIQIAIKALELTGEIITTPFSYVATTSSIVWEGCIPVFVDINPDFLTIDETKIEDAITPQTTGILATHVFGNPCNVEVIEEIAKKHNLKVIYDAAHCFGVTYKGESVFNYGDVSTCSFHATKLFHTGEGGAIFSRDDNLINKLFYHHNFGHKGKEDFYGLGINAKMSELQAAMGLSIFPFIEQILKNRKRISTWYRNNLSDLQTLKIRDNTEWNHSYFPVIFQNEEQLLKVISILNANQINPRRYFYPSLDTLPYSVQGNCPKSKDIASRILCLPSYYDLSNEDLGRICKLILSVR